MRRLRIILAVAGLAAALVVVAALVAPHAVDTGPARQAVARWISGLLGREVRIEGRMRFTLLPILGFVIEDLSVSGAADPGQEPLARIRQASMRVAPWPLLQRRFMVERVHLEGARIDLVRAADGRTNWEGVSLLSRDPGERAGKTAALMQFEEVTVSDGSVHLRDAVAGRDVVVSQIAFRRRGKGSRTFAFGAQAVCRRSPIAALEQLSAAVHLTGNAVVLPSQDRYAVENADLRLTLQRPAPADAPPLVVLEAVVSGDALKRQVSLEKVRITGRGAHLSGSLSGGLAEGALALEAQLHLQIEALRDFIASLGVALPPASGYRLPRTADLEARLSLGPGRFSLAGIRGTVDEIPVAGDLSVAPGRPLSCQAALRTGEVDLDAYLPPASERVVGESIPPPLQLALDLTLEAEGLRWRQHHIGQAALHLRHLPGEGLQVETASGRFAGGDWRLNGKLESGQQGWAGARMTLAARDAVVADLWPSHTAHPLVRGRVDLDVDLAVDDLDPTHFLRRATGKVAVATRRPLQMADGLRTKLQGRLTAELAPERKLGLQLRLESRLPDLNIDLKSQGAWDLQTMVLDGHQTSLSVDAAALPGRANPLHLEGGLTLSLPRRRAVWHQARISLPAMGVTARGDLDLARVDGVPVMDARLDILPLALRPFLEKLGWTVKPKDPAALGQMSAALRLHYDGRRLAVRDLLLRVDDSQVKGTVDIAAFNPLEARFELDLDRVDLDRYLPRDQGAAQSHRPSTDAPAVDLAGTLTIGQLTLFGLTARDVSAEVTADRRRLLFDPVHLTLYQGATSGMFALGLDDADPAWQTRAAVKGTQLRRPLEILFGKPILSGPSDIAADLQKRRKKGASTVAGLNGKLNFTVRNGKMHGVRIVSAPDRTDPQSGGSAQPGGADEPFQPFDLLEGSWTLTDGVAVTEDHRLSVTGLAMAAAGWVDFPQKRLDATLSVDLPTIPVVYYTLNGPFGDIRVNMDRSRLVRDTTTGIVTSPLRLGQGTLGMGAEILERGGEAIGDESGVQRLGQGAMSVGQGVLELGKGVLELHKGGESLGEGARRVGEGVAGMGKGVVGIGKDALNVGVQALEGFGQGLERLFGGGEEAPPAKGEESRPGAEGENRGESDAR